MVVIETSLGAIHLELDHQNAPVTTASFLRYVDEGHYDGTVFHRVIPGFMVQGGGYGSDMREKPTHEPIRNEAGNGLRNRRGTVAMARTNEVDSASAQFFVNVADNDFLDHRDKTPAGFGYAVFAEVVEGMDVVDKIVAVPTGSSGSHEDVPVEPVAIVSARRTEKD